MTRRRLGTIVGRLGTTIRSLLVVPINEDFDLPVLAAA
jgi:hypothetical protein